jgi:hypothetical protein
MITRTSQVLQWYLARKLPVTPVHPVRSPLCLSHPWAVLTRVPYHRVEGERARGSGHGARTDSYIGTH